MQINNKDAVPFVEKEVDTTPKSTPKVPSRKISEKDIMITNKDEIDSHDLSDFTQNMKENVVSFAQDVKRAIIIDEINDSISENDVALQ